MSKRSRNLETVLAIQFFFVAAVAILLPARANDWHFTRLVAHWTDYNHPDYLPFIEDARPEVVQVGFYGAHFYSLVHTPFFGGYPAHFPVQGLEAGAAWFKELNRQLHTRGAKVIGHFNVEFLIGDPDGPNGPTGFFHFYHKLWDEERFGPKPTPNPIDLLERDRSGKPISDKNYGIGGMREYWACLRNPAWQTVLKTWVRRGIELGLDGFIANYFYRHNCLCIHCQNAFRKYLGTQFTAEQLRAQFGISELATHVWEELVSWHDPKETNPLRLEMLRFSQLSNKEVFDHVFIDYGRSLKPDLIVAQWNHLGDFSQIAGDERCLLPAQLWGRDETYLWYSTGDQANYSDLKARILGEATLQARYIRGAFDDKPFTLGKYESTRIRTAIAELAANGGAPMGFYTSFRDPQARDEIVRYYRFLQRHEPLFKANRSYSELALVFPRSAVHSGNVQAVTDFKRIGSRMLESHLVFDVVPDDSTKESKPQERDRPFIRSEADLEALDKSTLSRFDAPWTARVSASRPLNDNREIDFHFVNYDRVEPAPGPDGRPSRGSGIRDEKPVPCKSIDADVRLPAGFSRPIRVEFITPENSETVLLESQLEQNRIQFKVPGFLVYGIARLRTGY